MSSVALENTWTFWTSNMRGDPDVKFISQFSCIQEFWYQFRARSVNSIPDKTYLHVFKDGIKPLWEDPKNFPGGHFKLTARSKQQSENMWLSVLLNMLGEQFPHSELVNGASVMSNQVGNNLVKVWLASTDKAGVQATREFLHTILNESDFLPNVTFVPHKLVVKGAGKKLSNRITEATPSMLVTSPPRKFSDASSIGHLSEGRLSLSSSDGETPLKRDSKPRHVPGFHTRMRRDLAVFVPSTSGTSPCRSPPSHSPETALNLFTFGGALSSIPSSSSSEHSSVPPSPRPVSPTMSYTGSEWEADCGLSALKLMPHNPAFLSHPLHFSGHQQRSWSISSQDSTYTHNPYSLSNALIFSNP
eukprot:GGOE01012854.1.p1 GENE.GGOE01012854.1~~GGOE01012854.1.p1  ORF type:complete len:360 (+),score=32.95 GGOE01012854.1:64-1143(+)